MCGDECAPVMSQLDVKYPVEQGVVKDWDAMEHLYNYTFSQKLKIDPTESLILLTEAPRNPLENRIKFCEYMFETFGFQGMYLQIQAVLTLYAQGMPRLQNFAAWQERHENVCRRPAGGSGP
jgi:actin-related protein 2